MEKGTDPLTGETFTKMRSNQRFATRENQILYNNKKAAYKRKAKADIDRKLDKNRTILKKILSNQKEVVKSIEYLKGAGFDFFCQTHNCVIDGQKYNCVYGYAFCLANKEQVKIIRHD